MKSRFEIAKDFSLNDGECLRFSGVLVMSDLENLSLAQLDLTLLRDCDDNQSAADYLFALGMIFRRAMEQAKA